MWYGSFHTQTVRVVLVREDGTDTGYGLALVATDLTTPIAANASPGTPPKPEPAFSDMAAKLRRVIIDARSSPIRAAQPTVAEIREVQRAWAQAGLDPAA